MAILELGIRARSCIPRTSLTRCGGIQLQRVTKEGGGGYQVAHSGCTPLVESLIECKSLADSTGYGDAMPDSFEPYYSTFLLRSKVWLMRLLPGALLMSASWI